MSVNPSQQPASVDAAHGIDPAEWDTRVKLAACYRMVARLGMDDLIYNHISARIPGHADQFLISSAGPVEASFLNEISFQGYAPGAIAFNVGGGLYEIVPVPEPATIFGGAALLAFVGWRERRRLRRVFSKA